MIKITAFTAMLAAALAVTACKPEPADVETKHALGEIEAALCTGDRLKLSERFKPEDAPERTVLWFTTNPEIVSVSNWGDITAEAEGQADIFIVATQSALTGVCHITVRKCE